MTVRVTYLDFHLLVTVPAVVALAVAGRVAPARLAPAPVDRRRLAGLAVVVAVAVAYTTPWDNYLVGKGVWRYGDGLVAATVWHAPVGEYLFVVLQTLVVGLWLYRVDDGGPDREADGSGGPPAGTGDGRSTASEADAGHDVPARTGNGRGATTPTPAQRAAGVAAGLAVSAVGLALLATPATYYLGTIVAWVGPPLALQWGVGWPHLWARRRTVAVAVAVPSLYLAAADRLAIALGIWRLSPAYTTGLSVAGLPVEEAVFFLATTLLVVQGLVLYGWVTRRWAG